MTNLFICRFIMEGNYLVQENQLRYTGCITKIRINFNLNFPLYCAFARNCCWHPRKSDASSKHSYSQNGRNVETKEYNRRAAIIKDFRTGRSVTEIIRFFGYPKSTIYNVMAKYTALKQSNEGSICQRGRVTQKNAARGSPQLKGLKR